VESHRARHEMARLNFERAGVSGHVRQIFGHAPEVFFTDKFAGVEGFDLIFIDATKMEYASYLDVVLPMLNKGGFLIADNCVSHASELDAFFAEIKARELRSYLLTMDNGLMLVSHGQ
jgi:predicted O-methyltransferase YrrM